MEDKSEDDEPAMKKPLAYSRALELKELMDKNGWNQRQVAEYYDVSRARVSQILKILKLDQREIDKIKKDERLTERKVRGVRV